MRLSALLLIVSYCPLFTGCASHARDRTADDLKTELHRVRAEQSRLQARLEALETSKPALASISSEPRVVRPRLDVVVLRPGDSVVPEATAPESLTEEPSLHPHASSKSKRFHVGGRTTSDAAQQAYQRAAELMAKKQYAEACDAWTGVLVRYPEFAQNDEVLYQLAECYFFRSDWARAQDQLEGLIARFPRSKRLPDALSRLAATYQQRGQEAQAQETLTQLRSSFPHHAAARVRSASKEPTP